MESTESVSTYNSHTQGSARELPRPTGDYPRILQEATQVLILSEELTILQEIQMLHRRLRALAGTEMWETLAQEFNPDVRIYLAETLQGIENTARDMKLTVLPPDHRNYGRQR